MPGSTSGHRFRRVTSFSDSVVQEPPLAMKMLSPIALIPAQEILHESIRGSTIPGIGRIAVDCIHAIEDAPVA